MPWDFPLTQFVIIREELQSNVVEVLSPQTFAPKESYDLVVAHLSSKKIRDATIYRKEKKGKDGVEYIEHAPTRIVKYVNSIARAGMIASGNVLKYDITFESLNGIRFETGISSVEDILSLLRSNGHIYNPRIAESHLMAILNACYREERVEIKSG